MSRGRPKVARNIRMVRMRLSGFKLREIAEVFGVHVSRVGKIMQRLGVNVDLRFKEAS